MKAPLVSIITVNLNGGYLLKDWLASLAFQTFDNFEVIFVDNGSTDGSLKKLKIQSEKLKVNKIIENKKNLGFPKACNQGAKLASGKYFFFLNNDARLEKSCLLKLVSFMESHPKAAAAGPVIFQKDQKNLESAGFFLTLSGFVVHLPRFLPSLPYQVFGLSGAAMLVRKKIFDQIGGFDPDFFLYSEDADLCSRVRMVLAGEIWVIPEAKVYHLRGQTTQKARKSLIVYHATKNRLLFLLKNFSLLFLLVILPVHLGLLLTAVVLFSLFQKADRSRAVLKAILWNWKNFSPILKKRRKIQQLRVVSDWILVKNYLKGWPVKTIFSAALSYLREW